MNENIQRSSIKKARAALRVASALPLEASAKTKSYQLRNCDNAIEHLQSLQRANQNSDRRRVAIILGR
jgi:hypothetical protein